MVKKEGRYSKLNEYIRRCLNFYFNTETVSCDTVEISSSRMVKKEDRCLKSNESRCCINFYFNTKNIICDPCPPGTIGDNCSRPCPQGFYGDFCSLECNCGIGIPCLPTTGCVDRIPITNHFDTIIQIAVVVAIILLCLAVFVLCCCGLWKREINVKLISKLSPSKWQHCGKTIQRTIHNANCPLEANVRIYPDTSREESEIINLKRHTSEYNTLQLRINNISCNSFDINTMEKRHEQSNLTRSFYNEMSDELYDVSNIYDHRSVLVRDMVESDHHESNAGYKMPRFEVQVHVEPNRK